jgi:peroxiredoxin
MPLLNPGDPFPRLTIETAGGQSLTIPDAFAGDFAVVLFNRGAWCPYCNAQLRAFQRAAQDLADNGIRVAALSVDDQETAAALVEKHKLTFPVGYGADARAVAELTGAFVNPDPVDCSPPGSCSTPRVTSWSACTQAAPSGGLSPMTSSAWSATRASTRRRRRRDGTGREHDRDGRSLLLRPVPVRVDDEQVGAHGRRAA